MTPTEAERPVLAALALPTQDQHPDREGWWSASNLRSDPRTYRALGDLTVRQISGRASSLARKGMARTRVIGGSHGWAEYRITDYGRAMTGGYPDQDPDEDGD